jgi:peptidylprolyl isomerase
MQEDNWTQNLDRLNTPRWAHRAGAGPAHPALDAPADVRRSVESYADRPTRALVFLWRVRENPRSKAQLGPVRPAAIRHHQKASPMSDTIILETTHGPVAIATRPDLAPKHVARITELVRQGFYDGVVFHRVIEGFMAQTGDPTGTGMGGSGKKLPAEFSRERHVRGVVSMARSGHPDSADSQFFICFGDSTFLDGQYTVWGQVTEGMENIDKIKRGEPVKDPDKIISAKIKEEA